MKGALLIELAAVWELQAETGGDGLNKLQPPARETLRACADTIRMLVASQAPGTAMGMDNIDFNSPEYRRLNRVAPAEPVQGAVPAGRVRFELTHEQVQALYLFLSHGRFGGKERPETRPAFGWMEAPLVAIEEALEPAHSAIHDRTFNGMNRQFFGDDRFKFAEHKMPDAVVPAAPPPPSPGQAGDREARYFEQGRETGVFEERMRFKTEQMRLGCVCDIDPELLAAARAALTQSPTGAAGEQS